jgi:hypothetical protein
MRFVWMIVGVLAVVLGVLWTLQGLNIVGGSAMSGNSTWAIVGPIVAVVGMLAFLFGARTRNAG